MSDDRLDVPAGDTVTINSSVTSEWYGTDVDGTLEVYGTLRLVDNPDIAHEADTDALDLPLTIDLPTAPLLLDNMKMGTAMFIIGTLALLGGAWAIMKNYAAGIMWSFAFVALLASGLFQIGLELFWVMVLATVVMLIIGAVVKWI